MPVNIPPPGGYGVPPEGYVPPPPPPNPLVDDEGYHYDPVTGTYQPGSRPGAPAAPAAPVTPVDDSAQRQLLDDLRFFLAEWGLESLMGFVQQAIQNGWGKNQILLELRNQPEYKAAYPEVDLRKKNGFYFMSEAEIRAYRDEAKRLAFEQLGATVTNTDISKLIGKNISLDEYTARLGIEKAVQERGDGVKWVFENVMGVKIGDDDLREVFDPDVPNSKWKKAYEDALYRGLPALAGLGIRPQDEADTLRSLGIDPDKAFAGYQQIAGQLPMFEKMQAIEKYILGNEIDNEFTFRAPLKELIGGVLYGDAATRVRLVSTLQRQAARSAVGGSVASAGGQSLGLVPAGRRG